MSTIFKQCLLNPFVGVLPPFHSMFGFGDCVQSSDCLKRLDGLASLVLDLLCDSSECNCLSKSYFVLDHIRQSVEPLLITMANQKGNIQQQGMQCVVNDHLFARYLESFDKIVFMKINQLLIVLQNCSHKKHENIIVKYGVCPMCE